MSNFRKRLDYCIGRAGMYDMLVRTDSPTLEIVINQILDGITELHNSHYTNRTSESDFHEDLNTFFSSIFSNFKNEEHIGNLVFCVHSRGLVDQISELHTMHYRSKIILLNRSKKINPVWAKCLALVLLLKSKNSLPPEIIEEHLLPMLYANVLPA